MEEEGSAHSRRGIETRGTTLASAGGVSVSALHPRSPSNPSQLFIHSVNDRPSSVPGTGQTHRENAGRASSSTRQGGPPFSGRAAGSKLAPPAPSPPSGPGGSAPSPRLCPAPARTASSSRAGLPAPGFRLLPAERSAGQRRVLRLQRLSADLFPGITGAWRSSAKRRLRGQGRLGHRACFILRPESPNQRWHAQGLWGFSGAAGLSNFTLNPALPKPVWPQGNFPHNTYEHLRSFLFPYHDLPFSLLHFSP